MRLTIRNNILFENVIFLYILQGVNYALPLITLPYLVRVLGTEKYGLLAFAASFIQYFVIITDYGFNLTATQQISINKENIHKVALIYYSVLFVKMLLLLFCFIVFSVIVFSIEIFYQNWQLYYIVFLSVLGNVLFPTWLFQGMEKMKELSIISSSARVFVTLLIFIFIHKQSDYLLAALIQVLGVLTSGVIALVLIRHSLSIRFYWPSYNDMRDSAKQGWFIFISQLAVALFTNTNIFILGLFSNNTAVGYFAIADKIVRAVISISVPVTTSIYPRVSALFYSSKEAALTFLKKTCILGIMVFSICSLLLFIFADRIVLVIYGHYNNSISILIKIMSLLPLTVFLDNLWGTQVMLNIGLNKQFMFIITGAGMFSLICSLLLVPKYGANASATILLATEILILILMIIVVRFKNIYLLEDTII